MRAFARRGDSQACRGVPPDRIFGPRSPPVAWWLKHLAEPGTADSVFGMGQTSGETPEHRRLKVLALVWAQARGFAVAATEVRLPRSGFRADVAACALSRSESEGPAESAVFECKQSRADLLRDNADEQATVARLREVIARRRELEALLGMHLPNLRRGDTLFAECDSYAFDALRHTGWRAVRREEVLLQGRLHGGTKFARLRRYRCAHRLYLVVEPGVLEPHEVPLGWGLLERDREALQLRRRPERLEVGEDARMALLECIARAATRAVNAQAGIAAETVVEARRRVVPE